MVEPGYGEGRKWWRQGYEAGRDEISLQSSGLAEETNWYEYGYRLATGECVWGEDIGRDGSWTPPRPDLGVGNIDLYLDDEYRAIRSELDRAGLAGAVVVRRRVSQSRGRPEIVSE
jgi:hypothetical protein